MYPIGIENIFADYALIVNALWPIVTMSVAVTLAIHIVSEIAKAVKRADRPVNLPRSIDELQSPDVDPDPEPPSPPAPEPSVPERLPGWVWEDLATLVELARIAMRPAHCPQCGAPMSADSRTCTHCGTTV